MKTICLRFFALCLLAGVFSVTNLRAADALMAGTAKVNITPPNPKYPVHDSLYARTLLLDAGGTRIAFIALDLGGYVNERLAARLRSKYRLQEVYFCPQHTHSSQQGPKEWLEDRIDEAMRIADASMFEARISGGHRSFPQLSFCRLVLRDDGRARESWLGDDHYRAVNPERIPHGPVDNSVGVIKLEDMQGNPRVLVMNYACHPDVVWNNFEISADYVGYATKYTEEAFGGKVNCLFVQGGAGNQAPLFKDGGRKSPDDPRPCNYDLIERMGKLLSIEAVKLAKEIYPNPYDKPSISVCTDSLDFIGRHDKSLKFHIRCSAISINNRIAIAAMPGEPFIKFQLDWKREMQANNVVPFFFGYTWSGGTWPTYVPDIRSAAYGGFGAYDGPNGMIEVGAGERIFNKMLECYYRATGAFDGK